MGQKNGSWDSDLPFFGNIRSGGGESQEGSNDRHRTRKEKEISRQSPLVSRPSDPGLRRTNFHFQEGGGVGSEKPDGHRFRAIAVVHGDANLLNHARSGLPVGGAEGG